MATPARYNKVKMALLASPCRHRAAAAGLSSSNQSTKYIKHKKERRRDIKNKKENEGALDESPSADPLHHQLQRTQTSRRRIRAKDGWTIGSSVRSSGNIAPRRGCQKRKKKKSFFSLPFSQLLPSTGHVVFSSSFLFPLRLSCLIGIHGRQRRRNRTTIEKISLNI